MAYTSGKYSSIFIYRFKQLEKIGKEMKGGIQYHIIAGIQEVGIWEYNAVQKRITKICSIDWKGILKENETII